MTGQMVRCVQQNGMMVDIVIRNFVYRKEADIMLKKCKKTGEKSDFMTFGMVCDWRFWAVIGSTFLILISGVAGDVLYSGYILNITIHAPYVWIYVAQLAVTVIFSVIMMLFICFAVELIYG